MKKQPIKIFLSFFLSVFMGLASAQANVVSTGNQNFNTNPDGLDFLTVHSSETLKPGIVNFGVFLNNAVNTLPYFESGSQSRENFNDSLLGLDLNLGIGVIDNFELGLSFPFVISQSVKSDRDHGQFSSTGNTEIRLLGKYRFAGDDDGGWAAIFSTNFNRTGDNPYIGQGGGQIYNFELAWDTTIQETAFGVNVGYRKTHPGEPVPNSPIEPIADQVIASTAVSHLLKGRDTKLIFEIFGGWPAQRKSSNPDRANSSLEWLGGVKYDVNTHLALQAGGGTGLIHGASSPDWRVYAGLNYVIGDLFSKPQVKVEQTPEPQRFRLSNLNFDFDSDQVSEESLASLDEVVHQLQQQTSYNEIVIEGHTDSIGSEEYNAALSKKRADVIRKYLIERGFPAEKVQSVGFGESKPIADNGNFQGREKNRRVEFVIRTK